MDTMILNLPDFIDDIIKEMAKRRGCTEEQLYAIFSKTGCLKGLEDAPLLP